jgi:hypothetical protein
MRLCKVVSGMEWSGLGLTLSGESCCIKACMHVMTDLRRNDHIASLEHQHSTRF